MLIRSINLIRTTSGGNCWWCDVMVSVPGAVCCVFTVRVKSRWLLPALWKGWRAVKREIARRRAGAKMRAAFDKRKEA